MHVKSFWWGTDVHDLWFKGFTSKSVEGLIAICFLIMSLAFLFEYMRYLQTKQKQKELILRAKQIKLLCSTESAALLAQTITNPRNPLNITLWKRSFLFGTEVSLWIFIQNLGYFLMLGVMVYNGWFLVSAVIGGGIGYFVFGQLFMKINIQNCHIMREAYCTQICGEIEAANEETEGQSTPAHDSPSTSQNINCKDKKHVSHSTVSAQCYT